MVNIYVCGDSIAHGTVDLQGGWADRLKQHFVHQLYAKELKHKRDNRQTH